MKRILSVWHLRSQWLKEEKRNKTTGTRERRWWWLWGEGVVWCVLYRLVVAGVVSCWRVWVRRGRGRLVLWFDALGVRLFAGLLLPVLTLGGEGGRGGGVGRQQVEGAGHSWRGNRWEEGGLAVEVIVWLTDICKQEACGSCGFLWFRESFNRVRVLP